MLTSNSSQTTLKGYAFRPFEETWPADSRLDHPGLQRRRSVTKAWREMLEHLPSALTRRDG